MKIYYILYSLQLLFLLSPFCFYAQIEIEVKEDHTSIYPDLIEMDNEMIMHYNNAWKNIEKKTFLDYITKHPQPYLLSTDGKVDILWDLLNRNYFDFADELMDVFEARFNKRLFKNNSIKSYSSYLLYPAKECQIDFFKQLLTVQADIISNNQFVMEASFYGKCGLYLTFEDLLEKEIKKLNCNKSVIKKHEKAITNAIKENNQELLQHIKNSGCLFTPSESLYSNIYLSPNIEVFELMLEAGEDPSLLKGDLLNDLLSVIWKDASIQQIEDYIAKGYFKEIDVAHPKTFGPAFLNSFSAEKRDFALTLAERFNHSIPKLTSIGDFKTRTLVFPRDEIIRIVDNTANLNGYSPFKACFNDTTHFNDRNDMLLHQVAKAGDKELFNILIEEKNIDIHLLDSNGNNVVHYAVASNNPKFMKWLLTNFSVDINKVNKDNKTPLAIAEQLGFVEMQKILQKQ